MLCYALSLIDRQILSLLVGPLKRDLHISDTRIGLLQGFSFALFYTLAGLPLGRVADTRNRRNLITVGIIAWSVLTAACSAARNYWALFFTRMGVGVGEATLSPAAFSLIADYFPPGRLGVALSVYSMGIYIGSGLALIVGGTVVEGLAHRPELTLPILGTVASWRATFLVVGLPGFLIALLARTIREPQRRYLQRTADGQASQLGFREFSAAIAAQTRFVRRRFPWHGISSRCRLCLPLPGGQRSCSVPTDGRPANPAAFWAS